MRRRGGHTGGAYARIRRALKITARAAPSSARIAVQRDAWPAIARMRRPAGGELDANGKGDVLPDDAVVALLSPKRWGRWARLSAMSTTSAVSSVASEPEIPMAMPTDAAASAGASLIPSPTIPTSFPPSFKCSTSSTLLEGRSPART